MPVQLIPDYEQIEHLTVLIISILNNEKLLRTSYYLISCRL